MIVLEFKAKGNTTLYSAIDEAILTAQFVRNKRIRYWMDNRGIGQKELYRYNTQLRAEFPFVNALNSHACQVAVEWEYTSKAINRLGRVHLKISGALTPTGDSTSTLAGVILSEQVGSVNEESSPF